MVNRMAGYRWAVTGAALAFTAFTMIDFGEEVWATRSGSHLLSGLAEAIIISALFGAYSWGVAFLAAWPLFLMATSLARTLKTRSLLFFITFGALTGALFSVPLLALPRETGDPGSIGEVAMRIVPLCALIGVSGAGLFWWKAIRLKPLA